MFFCVYNVENAQKRENMRKNGHVCRYVRNYNIFCIIIFKYHMHSLSMRKGRLCEI